jgi:adenylate cyclase
MFTDMVGYTALGQKNEALSLALVEEQRNLIRPILVRHGGREVKTIGDAFLVEFHSVLDAVRCAYEIQRTTREFNLPLDPDRRVHLRVGVHVGDVVESGGDILGDAVNLASRIEPLAEDGGVCLTRQAYDHVQNKLGVTFVSMGEKRLKNVTAPLEVFKLVMPWEETKSGVANTIQDIRRIAVLPFANISPDPGDEYFADGLTEEMIARLSRLGGLDVIARTSIMTYKKKEKIASQIGKELGAGTLLEGSVRKAGNKIRVTIQLIDSNTEGHLWAENYDRNLDDIFTVQSEIAEQVARSLEVHLRPRERTDIEKKPTENLEAYSLYLKGRQTWFQYNLPAFKEGLKYFEQAIKLDPSFALAHAGVADCYSLLGDLGYLPQPEAIAKAESAAKKAVELDERLPEAHTALAPPRYHRYDWKGADAELLRAIELRPSYSLAHAWHGVILRVTGRLEEAHVEYMRAFDLDPLSPLMSRFLSFNLYQMRRYDEAISQAKRTLELDPSGRGYHGLMGLVYLQKQKYDEAIGEMKALVATAGSEDAGALSELGMAYALAGKRDEAKEIIGELERPASGRYVAPDHIAMVYLMLGEREIAFRLFEKAIDELCSFWIDEMGIDPLFDPYRSDKRFVALIRRLGLES